jgi:hypothetical protein
MISRLAKPEGGIQTLEQLRDHLQIAIEVEHSVIPPYLSALYSIVERRNGAAVAILRRVVVEEMLHMTLVANVLNAIDGHPDLLKAEFIPGYPSFLPHGNDTIVLNLAKFSREAVAGFLQIEHPSAPHAPPEADHYASLGQFYKAVEDAVVLLAEKHPDMFHGKLSRQVTPEYYYNSAGEVIVVTDLTSALKALRLVVVQGEGRHHSIYDEKTTPGREGGWNQTVESPKGKPGARELAHYFAFNQIYEGRYYREGDTPATGPTGDPFPVDWHTGVYPMRRNPRTGNYPPTSDLWRASNDFNQTYMDLLALLHAAYNGQPDRLLEAVPAMFRLKAQAHALMKVPSGYGDETAGPSFEYVKPRAAKAVV